MADGLARLCASLTAGSLFDSAFLFVSFVAILFAGSRFLPGRRAQGPPLPGIGRRTYVLNGLALFLLCIAAVAAGAAFGWIALWRLPVLMAPLFVVANAFAFALSIGLYAAGRRRAPRGIGGTRGGAPDGCSEFRYKRTSGGGRRPPRGRLAATRRESVPGGSTAASLRQTVAASLPRVDQRRSRGIRNASLADFFFGVEHSPAWGGVDLKLFSYRPSLIGLALVNLSFAAAQYAARGGISDAMALYQVFTLLYVFNYFQFEEGMLFTWDVASERFGWMLVWGDYVLVPFFYSLPGWFLIDARGALPGAAIPALVTLYAFGFWLFRGANGQKHRFRKDPRARIWGRPAQTLDGRLLVSGFWGIGRHLNYTGEILVYTAFALTAGFASPVPYLLPLWLTGLLLHRAWRDERRCRAKYGALWECYAARARFRMVPFVY